jgi:hypothetical protein
MVVGVAAIGGSAASNDANAPKLWTLEGELKVHPKFLYRYYLEILNGQKCALYGADGESEKALASIPLPAFVRVRGTLGTKEHTGGTPDNPSPFPKGWIMYMDVHEAEALKIHLSPQPEPGAKP